MTFLLDTNVISAIRRANREPAVQGWFASIDADDLRLSVLTVGEICKGAERLRRRDARGAGSLDRWLAEVVSGFGPRVVDIDFEIAQRWGALGVPDPLPAIDGLLAATALVHDWTLVTRNTKDMARTGVRLLNPWDWPDASD
jgi:toxin FitB